MRINKPYATPAVAAAALIRARRPQHTAATLEAQRRNINAWVTKWQTDRRWRNNVLENNRSWKEIDREHPIQESL